MFHARRLLLCDAQLQVQPHPHRTTSMSLGKVSDAAWHRTEPTDAVAGSAGGWRGCTAW